VSSRAQRVLRPEIAGVPVPGFVIRGGRAFFRTYGAATSHWRPPPDFLVAGGKRCGTTSLYFHLLAHPDNLPMFPSARHLPKARDGKGPHFFDQHFERGPAWYLSHFPSTFERDRHARATGQRPVTGEASPYSLYHPLAPTRARALFPDLKIIFMLRDPVQRTHSHWREQTRNGVETLGLRDAIAAEPSRVGEDELLLRTGEIARSYAHENQSYVGQSEYVIGLRRWLEHYPRDRVLVLFSEHYFVDPAAVVSEIYGFLGLRPVQVPSAARLNAAPPNPLPADMDQRLRAHFMPLNDELSALLDRRLPWDTG
jgi:hypothetical protein